MFYNLEILVCIDTKKNSHLLLIIWQGFPYLLFNGPENDKVSCLKQLENITFRLHYLLLIFYENLTEFRVSHSVWLSYVQGFQGWGVGRMIDGKFVKYDGLFGSHVLFFQALDAFLGMDRYLTDEDMIRYIPVNQKRLCITFKKYSFRTKAKEHNNMRIENEFTKIVNRLKVRLFFHLFVNVS